MRLSIVRIIVGSALLLAVGGLALSMESHQGHEQHGTMDVAIGLPIEGGQSAFAAIAEIVALLEADPQTDWSQVNIPALRNHLVDMNELTLRAEAEQVTDDDRVVFTIRGEGTTLRAIQAMVPAHAVELNRMDSWSAAADLTSDGAVLSVKPDDADDLVRISALGFMGLMATGAHHQPHHLAIAKGIMTGH